MIKKKKFTWVRQIFQNRDFSYNYELNVLIRDKKTKDNVIKFVFDLFQNSDVIKIG